MTRQALFGLFLIVVAVLAHAGDGVLEINSACVNDGCYSGDEPGFPVEINQSGSFMLTSNLSVNVNTTAILIQSDDVTLDLNGFTISGPVSCSAMPTTCNTSGIGVGIDASDNDNVTIRNGTVRGMGDEGISVRAGQVLDVTVSENAGTGLILPTEQSRGSRIRAVRNGVHGIFSAGHITNSSALGNSSYGIFGGACSNSRMFYNGDGSSCVAILPNQCFDSTDCD